MYFETHTHYDFNKFDHDRDELFSKLLPEAGVSRIINIGINTESSKASIEFAKKYDYIYASIGFHPNDTDSMKDGDIDILRQMTKEPKVVAIGEIGLDYHYEHCKKTQKKCFEEHLELAFEKGLPVIIHARDSHEDVYSILKESGAGKKVGGVMHCFSASAEMAVKYIEMGFHIGVGGVVTYKNGGSLREVVEIVPKNRLLIETDCPYLSPEPNRGKRNDSRNLRYIIDKISDIWGMSHEETAGITYDNAVTLFLNRRAEKAGLHPKS